MRKYFNTVLVLLFVISCNKIEYNGTLEDKDLKYITSLKLLENDETIFKFYSEYKKKVAGNFFTDRRIATYWINERNSDKNNINFAFYPDIKKIDTIYNAGLTYNPYMIITRMDGSNFKVSVNGEKGEIKSFFEGAIRNWKKSK